LGVFLSIIQSFSVRVIVAPWGASLFHISHISVDWLHQLFKEWMLNKRNLRLSGRRGRRLKLEKNTLTHVFL
jgi:hypothetical protein